MIIQLLLKFISCFYSSSLIHRVLNDITTKYVLMIDSSVEFTHNSNLPRMLALLQSNQVSVVSPMTEDAVSQTLSSNCFQVYISSVFLFISYIIMLMIYKFVLVMLIHSQVIISYVKEEVSIS